MRLRPRVAPDAAARTWTVFGRREICDRDLRQASWDVPAPRWRALRRTFGKEAVVVLAVGVRQGVVDLNDMGPSSTPVAEASCRSMRRFAAAASPRFALSKSTRMLA